MDHFALLPAAERATVFREAAACSRLGSATIIEKDFWVCWALQRIFSSSTLARASLQRWNLAVEGLQDYRSFF
jgi:hypothetical protein